MADEKVPPTLPEVPLNPNISPRNIEDEMKTSYIDYSMSVIVGRALPDVRDGLKPVHRRILFTMKEMGMRYNTAYKKSARVVGDVLGKYHPHGDSSVYEAIVRMVQSFSLRYPLIDGQGNFGSIDGDSAAAMRYTEVRLKAIADEMLADLDKDTVNFTPNYDGSLEEPTVLPARYPNLLVNGSTGIAVGMATNIPTHNLTEVIDGTVAYIDNPDVTIADLMKHIKGPDFPTAGFIYGKAGIKSYCETGRGSIIMRAKAEIEEMKGNREAIIINELPYQVNKAQLIENIANLVRDKKLEGISDIRDESDRDGIRVVIEIKRDGNAQIVLNQLFKHTQMEASFGVIMLALVNNKPRVLNIKEVIHYFVEHRRVVIVRRTKFELAKAEARAHILEGLKIALDNLDAIIKTIKESADTDSARTRLMDKFKLSKLQAQAILDMKLQQLTGLERNKIEQEYLELIKLIEKLRGILIDDRKVLAIIREELLQVKEKFGDTRKTKILSQTAEDYADEDLIQEEDVVVTLSHAGYIKRIPATTYRSQKRGGKGIAGMTTREDDFVESMFVTSTHAHMLMFTSKGRVHWIRVFEIPEGNRTSKGKAIVNLLQIASSDEKITAAIPIRSFEEEKESYLFMCTKNGTIKKTSLAEYDSPRKGGIIGINLDEGDSLIEVKHTQGDSHIIIATKRGIAIRFKEENARPIGRVARGVRGISLEKGDEVVGMEAVTEKDIILAACVNGHGKRSQVSAYRLQTRGGKGVINIKTTERNGHVVGIKKANEGDEIMLMTEKGITIRQSVKDVSIIGRNAQGVRLVRLDEGDKLAAIATVVKEDDAIADAEQPSAE
ncbi:MAG: DNA gyrase subunit A [Elusimicrobia bacterium]|nr:DNA gyrase subunit A [Elusimicrobiota bacterium]